MTFEHQSVLLRESVDLLNVHDGGIYLDGTLGGGGHSEAILKRAHCRLIGLDRDDDALAAARERLKPFGDRVTLVKANFADAASVLDELDIPFIDGCILDLGVSSHQLDTAERGFSYQHSAPLDMRMDQSQYMSAFNVVNEYSERELTRIIRDYGEEQWASRIAQYIVAERQKGALFCFGSLKRGDAVSLFILQKQKEKGYGGKKNEKNSGDPAGAGHGPVPPRRLRQKRTRPREPH